jgi:hypothetical protein
LTIGEFRDFCTASPAGFDHRAGPLNLVALHPLRLTGASPSIYQPDSAHRSFLQCFELSDTQAIGSSAVPPTVIRFPEAQPSPQISPRTSAPQPEERGIEN